MQVLLQWLLLVQLALNSNAFKGANRAEYVRAATSRVASRVLSSLWAQPVMSGRHGEGFRFMPMIKATSKEHFPRILQIAGVYPDLTPEELLAPGPAQPSAPQGSWGYDFSDLSGVQGGKVAIPGSIIITQAVDPVVLITTSTHLGVPSPSELEMLVVVDRGNKRFHPDDFFVFRTRENTLKIQWSDRVPDDMEIIGKVVTTAQPYLPSMRRPSTGFAEEDEEDDD